MSGKAWQPRQVTHRTARLALARERGCGRAPAAAGYTLAHAGRQIRFGPVAFWIVVGTVVIMAGWSAVTATYFAFRDDVVKGLLARQAERQFAYEDRIAFLRAQIDRISSRKLLDQEEFEQKLGEIARRQARLESREASLSALADPMPTGSIKSRHRGSMRARRRLSTIGRRASLEPVQVTTQRPAAPDTALAKASGIDANLARLEVSLDRVEQQQAATLRAVTESYEDKARRMRTVLADLGLRHVTPAPASGGPFVPVTLPRLGKGAGFARALTRASVARAQADELSHRLLTVPLRHPVGGALDVSSPFGVRMDPFLHVPAMHTGVDFRGDVGEAVRATAPGKVTVAGWSGGYGKMVEIDHGDGLSTRYGHFSEIDVSVGEKIRLGQIIGRMGSTGRSTGPHLHYETRVEGRPVDPQKFLRAGAELFGN